MAIVPTTTPRRRADALEVLSESDGFVMRLPIRATGTALAALLLGTVVSTTAAAILGVWLAVADEPRVNRLSVGLMVALAVAALVGAVRLCRRFNWNVDPSWVLDRRGIVTPVDRWGGGGLIPWTELSGVEVIETWLPRGWRPLEWLVVRTTTPDVFVVGPPAVKFARQRLGTGAIAWVGVGLLGVDVSVVVSTVEDLMTSQASRDVLGTHRVGSIR